jgi:hypothetical protein
LSDTDSLILHIETTDVYEDIYEDLAHHFDTSEYRKDHPLYSAINKKVPGKMKGEACKDNVFNVITEFAGLRSRMYAIQLRDEVTDKKGGNTTRRLQRKGSRKQW